MSDSTDEQPCRTCGTTGGGGEVRHPLYGHPSCPEPTMPCPECG